MKKTKLIETRKNKGISQETMADLLFMDVSGYSRRETGHAKITAEQWKKIAKALQVPIEEIYEADENMIFIFNDHATGNGNIVTNYSLPQEVLDLFKRDLTVMEQMLSHIKEVLDKANR
jgi:transcriptional regulator with XRE-family HTH domain